MGFNLKDTIFGYFTRYEKDSDPYKDSMGKGTLERFNEMLAEDLDLRLLPLIKGILDNTIVPDTMLDKFIPYLESMLGLEPLVDDLVTRRKILKNIVSIYKVKGTLRSYQILFRLLGFDTVEIKELSFLQGFDSSLTFDDDSRRFDDSNCQPCTYYNLHLTGNFPNIENLYGLIIKAVALIEPINAKLRNVIYNQNVITFSIFVEQNGDLIYDRVPSDPTDFSLLNNGNLLVQSVEAQKFNINKGDLLKNK